MLTDKITKLHQVIQSEYDNINGILVLKQGEVAYEQYFKKHDPQEAFPVASVAKSIVSALIGIALQQGYLQSVSQKIIDFFPEYEPSRSNPYRNEITIEHLLTMTAPYAFPDWQEPLQELCTSPNWAYFTLDMLGEQMQIGGPTIGSFKYSTAGVHLLSAIISRATGKSALAYANEVLFAPSGMSVIPDYNMKGFGFDDLFGKEVRGWVHDPQGITTGGFGLTLTLKNMARFGLLYLQLGYWDQHSIIPETWVRTSTKHHTAQYGYLWWLLDDRQNGAFAAIGDGGNIICCIPDKEIVVAIASDFMVNPKDRWEFINQHLLPAIEN